MLTSFVTESPLTGFGAGGFMLVHTADGADGPATELIDFFVAAGGADGAERGLSWLRSRSISATRSRTSTWSGLLRGPGNPAGLERVAARYGSLPLARLIEPGVRLAREGHDHGRAGPSTRSCIRS